MNLTGAVSLIPTALPFKRSSFQGITSTYYKKTSMGYLL